MSVSVFIQMELAAQFRDLWTSVPPPGAPVARLAWWQLRKAEFWDSMSATHPALSLQAKEISTRARYQARALTGESRSE